MKFWKAIAVLAVGAFIAGGSGHALAGVQDTMAVGHSPVSPPAGMSLSLPGLTTDQQLELKKMFQDFSKKTESRRNELSSLRLEMDSLAKNPSSKIDVLSDLSQDIDRLDDELRKQVIAFQDQVAKKFAEFGLTPGEPLTYGRDFV